MKEYPIPFPTSLVRALLADRKHVTRRMSKRWLKVKAGDRLWVRENLRRGDGCPWTYEADAQAVMVARRDETAMLVWAHHKEQDYCSSMFMPRWASRVRLECEEDARVERLQDITEEEARIEGCHSADLATGRECILNPELGSYRLHFQSLWDTLHTKPGERFDDDPEVVRVGRFHRISDRRLP